MKSLIIVSIIAAFVTYIAANFYFSKHPSDGTHSYGFTMDPWLAGIIAILIGALMFLLG